MEQEWIEYVIFFVLVYKPFRNPDSLFCSVKAVPPVSMRKELHPLVGTDFVPFLLCKNGSSLRPCCYCYSHGRSSRT